MIMRWALGLLSGLVICAGAPRAWAAIGETVPTRLTFADAIELATRRYAEVLLANERTLQALARLGQARSVLWPQITASASQSRQTKNLDALGIPVAGRDPVVGPFNAFDARATLTQTLFDAAAFERLLAARAGRQLSLAQYEQAKQDAMALVAALFLKAMRAAQAIEPAHALLVRDQRRVAVLSAQQRLGLGSAIEVERAQADETESRARWGAAMAEAYERELDLIAALHLPADQPLILLDEDDLPTAVAPISAQGRPAVEGHPDIVVAQRLITQRNAERSAERADFLPTMGLSADYGASGTEINHAKPTYTIGANISMPLFEGGRRLARLREVDSRVREGHTVLDDVRRQVEVKVLQAAQTLQQSAAALEAKTAHLRLAATQLSLAQQRLRTGLGSELEVVEIQANAAVAKDNRADAIATYRLAQVTLAHAMGHVEQLASLQTADHRPQHP